MTDAPSTICCDISRRGRLRLRGEDRARFLNGQVTNDILRLAPGRGCYAVFTNAKGKMRADGVILNTGECFLVDLEPGCEQRVAAELEKFVIADDVSIENITNSWSAWTITGKDAAETLQQNGLCDTPPRQLFETAKLSAPSPSGGFLLRSRRSVDDSFDVWMETPQKNSLLEILTRTVKLTDPSILEILRVEAAIPRFGAEMDENTLPQEAGIEAIAISYSKGCYIGQEVISRIKSMGRVNRTLVRLQLPPAAQAGDPLRHHDREVGRLGSAVTSMRFGRIGLAIVRREASTPNSLLSLPQGGSQGGGKLSPTRADMTRAELEIFLATLGVPAQNTAVMAQQLEKRARQLSEKRAKSYEESLAHLIFLLKQGWAAKQGKKPEVGSQESESGMQKTESTS